MEFYLQLENRKELFHLQVRDKVLYAISKLKNLKSFVFGASTIMAISAPRIF